MMTNPLTYISATELFKAHKTLVDDEEFVLRSGDWNIQEGRNRSYVVSRDRGDGDCYDLIIEGRYALLLINASGAEDSVHYTNPEEDLKWIPKSHRHLLKHAASTRISDGSMYLTSAWESHSLNDEESHGWVNHLGTRDITSPSTRILRPALKICGVTI